MAYNGPQDSRVFSGVMDQDSAQWAVRDPDYRIAINLDNTVSDGDTGSQNNIPGDKLVSNPYLRPGLNKTIGYYEDVPGSSVIYLVYNSNGYHSIFRWFAARGGADGLIEKVWQVSEPNQYDDNNPDPLNFQPDKRVTGINMRGDILFFTDAHGQPKSINLTRANETNKPREWKLYFNRQNLGNLTVYTLDFYDNGLGIETASWQSSASSLLQRVTDAETGLQNTTNFKVKAFPTYLLITANSPGQYFMKATGLALFPDRLVPSNFYPDYTNLGVNSYSALPSLFFNRIKNPPFCRPNAEYAVAPGEAQASIVISRYEMPLGQNTGYAGFSSVINTIPGLNITSSGFNVPAVIGFPASNITAPAPIVINIRIQLSVDIKFAPAAGQFFNPIVVFNNTALPLPTNGTTLIEVFYPQPAGVYSADITFQQTINPGDKFNIYFEGFFTQSIFLGGTITITEDTSGSVEKTELSQKSTMFRVRNVYESYQESVLSQSTSVLLPTLLYIQKRINIDLWEKWVQELPWCSTLIQKQIAVSDDGGTTWNEVKSLEPHEFVCENDSTYIYTGKEGYVPIDAASAIKQYDDTPLLSQAQEMVDNRIWDAGVVKGYDKIQVELTLGITVKSTYNTEVTAAGASVECFRPNARHYVGVVYYDDADRKSGVCLGDNSYLEVPDYLEGDMVDPGFVYGIRLGIRNEPPAWATKYRIVRTRDLSVANYLLWVTNTIDVVDRNGVVVPFPFLNAAYWKINLDNIAEYINTTQRGAIIEYTYEVGDRIRFIAPTSTKDVPATPILDAEIVQYDAASNSIFINYNTALTLQGYFFELYSPLRASDINDLQFYEIGNCMEIKTGFFNGVFRKYHTSNIPGALDQTYYPEPSALVAAAVIESYNGGSYARMRSMISNTPTNIAQPTLVFSNFANEFAQSKFDGTYRPNIIDLPGRTELNAYVNFSNQWVSDRWFGINENEAANFTRFEENYGKVVKLVVINNNVLKVVFDNGYQASIYVNQGVIRQTQGGGNLISVSDQVAGNTNMVQRSLGTINPESVVINDEADVFGWDEKAGVVWRSSGNGLVPVSAYKMMATFNQYSLQRKAVYGGYSQVPAVYDIFRDQYIISLLPVEPVSQIKSFTIIEIGDLSTNYTYLPSTLFLTEYNIMFFNTTPSIDIMTEINLAVNAQLGWSVEITANNGLKVIAPDETYNGAELILTLNSSYGTKVYKFTLGGGRAAGTQTPTEPATLFFAKAKQGWPGYYSFAPECYGRLRNRILQFGSGELWLYREGNTPNNFMGVQYGSAIKWTLNKDYPKVKVPLALWYRGKGNWGSKVTVSPTDSYPTGQETEMTPLHFELAEDGRYTAVLRNRLYLTPEFPTTDQAWVNGDEIREAAIDIELYNNESLPVRLDSAKSTYFYSENS